jgi:hypothetical protein
MGRESSWFIWPTGVFGTRPVGLSAHAAVERPTVANWVNGEVARLAQERGEAPPAWKLTPPRVAAVHGPAEVDGSLEESSSEHRETDTARAPRSR